MKMTRKIKSSILLSVRRKYPKFFKSYQRSMKRFKQSRVHKADMKKIFLMP